MKKLFFAFFLFISLQASSQNFIAFADSMRFLYTFDEGYIRRLEERPIGDYKFGLNRVAYNVPYDNLFKLSIGTGSMVIFKDSVNDFWFSRDMLVYLTPNYLNCFWNGRARKLEFDQRGFAFSDSTVAWVDRFNNFKCFFNGYTREIDNRVPRDFQVAENLVAWKNIDGFFKIFWNDSVYLAEQYDLENYKTGMNTCAYVSNQGVFKIFHKGRFIKAESLGAEMRYMVADDMVAWTNVRNELWVFYNGEMQMLEQYVPENIGLADKLLYYSQPSQYFRVFDKGNVVELESYLPRNISIFDSKLAYLDMRNHLKLYESGFSSDVSKEQVYHYSIFGNIISYSNVPGTMVILYKGQKTKIPMGVRSPWGR